MRWSFVVSLILTLALGSVYWYQSGAHLCPAPLSYRLGTLDPSFNLAPETALAHIKVAEDVWERSTGRELFTYNPSARFTINFEYDERQAENNAEQSERDRLDIEQLTNGETIAELEELEYSYDALVREYENKAAAYEVQLQSYNETVQRYNDQGGALPDTFAELETEREELASTRDALTTEAARLNQVAAELAEASAVANERILAYNARVSEYNTKYGEAREFTQGDYQGDLINIYTFRDAVELERVLAHEFGHALGVGHVEGTSSIMYYLVTDSADTPELSLADTDAFLQVCGSGEQWDSRLRAIIRSIITG